MNAGTTRTNNVNNVGNVYLQNNLFYGFRGLWVKVSGGDVNMGLTVTFDSISGSNDYKFLAEAGVDSEVRTHAIYTFSLYTADCLTASQFVNTNRNSCVAACDADEYSDVCNRCWPCDVTCATCQEMAASECLTCVASRTFTAGVAPAGSCPCATGFLEFGTVQAACQPCHYTCATCLVANNQNQCDGCTVNRTPTPSAAAPFACPCSAAFVEISQACQPCATGCTVCAGTTTFCTACDSGSGYWLSRALNSCALSCPAGEYMGPTPGQCEYCDGSSPNFCATCTSQVLCTFCVSSRVLLVNSCVPSCPVKMFNNSGICTDCPAECALCQGLTSCQVCEAGFFLHNSQCPSSCPADYVPEEYNLGGFFCLNCDLQCVKLVGFTIGYTDSSARPLSTLTVKIVLSEDVNFIQNLLYYYVPFEVESAVIRKTGTGEYELVVTPVCKVLVNQLTKGLTSPVDRTIRGTELGAPLFWEVFDLEEEFRYTYLCGPGAGASESLNIPAEWLYNVTRNIPAELRVFLSFGAPSFQLTSCVLFASFPLPRQVYDGLRLISLGNLFDIPSYEADTAGRAVFGGSSLSQLNRTRLLSDEEVPFRLFRTALGSYFIYNTYIQLLFILGALLVYGVLQVLYRCGKAGPGVAGFAWSLLDFALEYFIMYLFISSVITIQSYQTEGWVSIVSLVLCILINVGFTAYSLYRFNDFCRLARANPGN